MDKNEFSQTATTVARNTIAVIDTMGQRGAIKGEELETFGVLRRQCNNLVHMAEEFANELAEAEEVTTKKK